MKNNNLYIVLIALMVISVLGNGNLPQDKDSHKTIPDAYKKSLKLDQIPLKAVELELKYTIPFEKEVEEKEIYFRNFINFSVDDRGHIYIPDGALCVIYELNSEGKLVSKYQKKGQGPGELIFPQQVYFHNNQVIVWDGPPRRIGIYDREWKFKNSISLFGGYIPFVLGANGLFYCGDNNGEKLISILDLEGKPISSFGERPYPNKIKSILNKIIAGVSPSGSIWVGMTSLGILRKYSPTGLIENEIDIVEKCGKLMKNILEQNFENDRNNTNISSPIIQSLAFIDEDVLVTIGGLVQPIFRISKKGEIRDIYYIKPRYAFDRKCMYAFIDQNRDEIFYILQTDEDAKNIGVYGRKKK